SQKPPDGFVVVGRTSIAEAHCEGVHESPHVLVHGAVAFDAISEGLCITQLPCPCQYVLIRTVDLARGPRCGNGKFGFAITELRLWRCPGDLVDDCSKYFVCGRKSNRSFDLNLKYCLEPALIMSAYDHIIEIHPFLGSLQFDPINCCTWKPAR